jgi:hypothetical protein
VGDQGIIVDYENKDGITKSHAFRACSRGGQIRDFRGGSGDPEVRDADRVRKSVSSECRAFGWPL